MRKKALWSVPRIKHPQHPAFTVRVGEYERSGTLHVFRWANGKQSSRSLKCRRVDLGRTPAQQINEAKRLGCEFIEELARAKPTAESPAKDLLTFSQLADQYETHGFAGRTDSYKRDSLAAIRRIAAAVGVDTLVKDLKPTDVQQYVAKRQAEGVMAAARNDVVACKIACNWAVEIAELLAVSPFAKPGFQKVMPPKPDARQPVATKARYEALKGVARELPPEFGIMLELAWHTGRRVGAIRRLRWDDLSFTSTDDGPHGTIRWYTGVRPDKKKHEHVMRMNPVVATVLKQRQQARHGIGGAFIFPAPMDQQQPVGYHVVKKWLRMAERKAKLPHEKQGGWHAFRRGWATIRGKKFPLEDVAAAGAWDKDSFALRQSYVHSDDEMRIAVETFVA